MKPLVLTSSLFLFPFLSGCAINSLAPAARSPESVAVVNQMASTEALTFNELGPLSCEALTANPGEVPLEICRQKLKETGAQMGADVVVIEQKNPAACQAPPGATGCLRIDARAYAQKPAPPVEPPVTYAPEPERIPDRDDDRSHHDREQPPQKAPPPWGESRRYRGDIPILTSPPSGPDIRTVGRVDCQKDTALGMGGAYSTDTLCRDDLQREAYDRGGAAIYVTNQTQIPCVNAAMYPQETCVKMTADVFAQ